SSPTFAEKLPWLSYPRQKPVRKRYRNLVFLLGEATSLGLWACSATRKPPESSNSENGTRRGTSTSSLSPWDQRTRRSAKRETCTTLSVAGSLTSISSSGAVPSALSRRARG